MEQKKKWYKSVSNWIFIIACVILVPILLINLWIMIQANTNPEEIPSVFGYKPFIVLSGSMETEIYKGDLIIAKDINPESLKVDDIIAFRDAENTVTTHRIIDMVEDNGEKFFITKGDNNNTQDKNLVEYDGVEGIYVMRIPGVGNIMNSLSEPTTIIILIMGITLIFVIGFMISNKKQNDIEKAEFLEFKKQQEEQKKETEKKLKEVKKESTKSTRTKSKTKSS